MKVIIFGASGMVGQGALHECFRAVDITHVVTIGRSKLEQTNAKLQQLVMSDMYDYAAVEDQLAGFDACFFCLGVSSTGMTEADYTHVTYDLTMAAAKTLARLNPQMTFVYVSGAGTDSSENGRTMWARVKGRLENDLLRLPFKAAYMFRPGIIQPMDGIKSKTAVYHISYVIMAPLFPVLRWLFPVAVNSTRSIGQVMLKVARDGAQKKILEIQDLFDLRRS